MLRFLKTQLVSVLVIYLTNGAIQARIFKDSSDQERSVFKYEGVNVIEFQIRLEKGAISLANPQFFSVSIDPKKLNTEDPESLYKAMISWVERPFNKDGDRDRVVHMFNDSTMSKPIIINNNELKLLLVQNGCRKISRIPRTSLSVPPTDYDKLYVVLAYDSIAIEHFYEKCRRLKKVRTIELIFPAVNYFSPHSGSRELESTPENNCKGRTSSFCDSDKLANRVHLEKGSGFPHRDDPPEGFSFTNTDRNMSIILISAFSICSWRADF